MLSAANTSGPWENSQPDNALSITSRIEVRRLANVLATDAARTITRHRNVQSCGASNAASVTSLDISALRVGAARHGSPPPVGSQLHRIALDRWASMKKLQQLEQNQLKPSLTQPRTRDGRRRLRSTYDYRRWGDRPFRYKPRRTQAQRLSLIHI